MAFSAFDRRLLDEGLDFFNRPRLAALLELLGSGKFERVETLTTMLQHGSPDEYDEAAEIFERATARAARERDREPQDEPRRNRSGGSPASPKARYSASAERREQRRRSS